jgi:hypothetical protein
MSEMNLKAKQPCWEKFQRLARERFPHGKVYGVRVRGGAVVAFERVLYTRTFGEQTPAAPSRARGDQWRRFMLLCQEAGDAQFPEVHFRDGEPYLAQMEEPGCELTPA